MRDEFAIKQENIDSYNYISGRIKVLETNLLSNASLEDLIRLPIDGIYKQLMETPYRSFISGSDADSISKAIFARYEAELSEIGRYVPFGFINVFFRSKRIFLKIKEWALVPPNEKLEGLDEELKRFLETGEGDFPLEFKEAFDAMKKVKDYPFKAGWLVDLYYTKYLHHFAEQTKSALIEEFFNTYAEGKLFIFLYRLSDFALFKEIDEKTFLETLYLVFRLFPESTVAKNLQSIKSAEEFKEFSKRASSYPFVLASENSLDEGLRNKLLNVLEKCKFINVGIEVIFMYLKRLEFEVENISMIVRGKSTGMNEKEISERISVAYA